MSTPPPFGEAPAARGMVEKPCGSCAQPFTFAPLIVAGVPRFEPRLCPVCARKSDERIEREQAEAKRVAREAAWMKICPEDFRQLDVARLPWAEPFHALQTWRHERGTWVGLYTKDSGYGKTRIAFDLLRRLHFSGVSVFAVSAQKFKKAVAKQHDDHSWGRDIIGRCYSARVLLFDDLGKEKTTDAAEAETFALIDERSKHRRPIIWTTNYLGPDLAAHFPQHGPYIVRRLVDYTGDETLFVRNSA